MSLDDQIEAALRQRPSDERTHDEPLTALSNAGGAVQRVGVTSRTGFRLGGRSGLAGLAAVVALVAGLVAIGPRLQTSSTQVDAGQQIQCRGWSDSDFSPGLLEGAGAAEKGTSTAAGVLRQFLASAYGHGMTAHGWYLVVDAADRKLFVASVEGGGPSDYEDVELDHGSGQPGNFAADGWYVGPYGSCTLRTVPPTGFSTAVWDLDRSVPFTPSTTELHILVSEDTCNSGQLIPADRIHVGVQYAADQVVVTVATRIPQGAETCPLLIGGTPYVVKLDQAIGTRALLDSGPWPAVTIARDGRAVIAPTQSPYPSNWHQPMDCTGTVDDAGFFKRVSMSATYDVYCALLPSGWSVASRSDPDLAATVPLTIEYRGPAGETFRLEEGKYGEAAGAEVLRIGPLIGTAAFGDRIGTLGGSGGRYYVYTQPDGAAMWTASCTGMTLDDFKTLATALIVVGK